MSSSSGGDGYVLGQTVSARVNDPDGNEHKIWFIKCAHGWEIE